MAYETLIYEKKGKIAYITFNRPETRNAMDWEMIQEISQAISEVEKDEDVGILILTGAGRAFISGGDIGWINKGADAPYSFYLEHDQLMRISLRLEKLPVPVIAAINGYALGGGLEIAAACDIRIASENARLGTPEAGLGIMPGAGGTARLPRIVGKGKALEMELTADPIDAQEAYRVGLVNKVVPEGEALKAAEEMANRILKNGPAAIRQIKNAIQVGMDMSLEGASEYCQKNAMMTCVTKDAREGTKAFLEKRPAVWTGR